MRIRLYQVGSGDCIHVKYSNCNIVIDAGFFSTVKAALFRIFEECRQYSEKVDLIVLTHTDQDHISGMKGLDIKKDYIKFLENVWINNPKGINQYDTSSDISFKQGENTTNMIAANNISYKSQIHNGLDYFCFKDAKITILSPVKSDLDKYNEQWEEYIGSREVASSKADWNISIDELISQETPLDNSNSNRVSIAFILSYGKTNALFMGDANPLVIAEKLQSHGYSIENPLQLDCIKLSHHGSSYNISEDFLKLIDCQNYMISSNSSYLDKLTLAKIVDSNKKKYNRDTIFYFNFPQDVYHGLITEDEIVRHGIKCHFAKNHQNYIELELED